MRPKKRIHVTAPHRAAAPMVNCGRRRCAGGGRGAAAWGSRPSTAESGVYCAVHCPALCCRGVVTGAPAPARAVVPARGKRELKNASEFIAQQIQFSN
ncbi:hypothetical protein EVAR_21445_1 [Eumeta japonica]|uniref:Uncharacterized protein n=1 Tax=Eumeta variegata TaxID=151549 RepID=A0A4C1VH62_EUMVA|nr:hypothetical protein EVAR_21445_1 [Eumeta japonica]